MTIRRSRLARGRNDDEKNAWSPASNLQTPLRCCLPHTPGHTLPAQTWDTSYERKGRKEKKKQRNRDDCKGPTIRLQLWLSSYMMVQQAAWAGARVPGAGRRLRLSFASPSRFAYASCSCRQLAKFQHGSAWRPATEVAPETATSYRASARRNPTLGKAIGRAARMTSIARFSGQPSPATSHAATIAALREMPATQ
jgi:hypothetical protein